MWVMMTKKERGNVLLLVVIKGSITEYGDQEERGECDDDDDEG